MRMLWNCGLPYELRRDALGLEDCGTELLGALVQLDVVLGHRPAIVRCIMKGFDARQMRDEVQKCLPTGGATTS